MSTVLVSVSGRSIVELRPIAPERQNEFHDGRVVCAGCHHQFRREKVVSTIDGFFCERCTDES